MAMDFPEEVIEEILSWLPMKSLMRFKCVSKPWLHLLTNDPDFIKLHFNRSNPSILLSPDIGGFDTELYYGEDYTAAIDDELTRFEIPFEKPFSHVFVNACNGLICLTSSGNNDKKAYVWNPLTGDHICIPSPPIPSQFLGPGGFPSNGIDIMFGFGFNEASDEYKVIRVVSSSPFQMTNVTDSRVSVYTLGSGSWRNLQQSFSYNLSLHSTSTALVNGALHWFGSKLNALDIRGTHTTLVAFNLQNETFQEIPQPHDTTYVFPNHIFVGKVDGLLSIFQSVRHESLQIWVMDEYGVADSWRKLCKIEHPNHSCLHLTPFAFVHNGDIIISKTTSEWVSYDPKTNSVKDLRKLGFEVYNAYTFTGSLLSPTIINTPRRA